MGIARAKVLSRECALKTQLDWRESKWESHGQYDQKQKLRADCGRPYARLKILGNYLYLKGTKIFLDLNHEKSGG